MRVGGTEKEGGRRREKEGERKKGKGRKRGGRERDREKVMEGMKYMYFEHCVSELKTK